MCIPLTFQLREGDLEEAGNQTRPEPLLRVQGKKKQTNRLVLARTKTNDLSIFLVHMLYHSHYNKLVGAASM